MLSSAAAEPRPRRSRPALKPSSATTAVRDTAQELEAYLKRRAGGEAVGATEEAVLASLIKKNLTGLRGRANAQARASRGAEPGHVQTRQHLAAVGGAPLSATHPSADAPVIPVRDLDSITAWAPKRLQQLAASADEETALARLSAEATLIANAHVDMSGLHGGMPAFLMEDDEISGRPSGNTRRPQHRHTSLQAETAATNDSDVEKLLRVGLVGVPNAGKSTLTNHLVGGKVSAVSIRPETTRKVALGAFNEGNAQVVIYDLPGVNGARDFASRSQAARVAATWLHVQECDVYALIVDCAKQLGQYHSHHVEQLAHTLGSDGGPRGFGKSWRRKPVVLLLNKADLLEDSDRSAVLRLAKHLGALCKPTRVFALSAQRGAGTAALRQWLLAHATPDEWEFPAGMPTDLTWPQLAAELVREKLYWAHTHEVPYRLSPACTSMQELSDNSVAAHVELLVPSHRMKQIVAGADHKRAARIEGRVGAELAHMLRRRVKLQLRVKVRKDAALPLEER